MHSFFFWMYEKSVLHLIIHDMCPVIGPVIGRWQVQSVPPCLKITWCLQLTFWPWTKMLENACCFCFPQIDGEPVPMLPCLCMAYTSTHRRLRTPFTIARALQGVCLRRSQLQSFQGYKRCSNMLSMRQKASLVTATLAAFQLIVLYLLCKMFFSEIFTVNDFWRWQTVQRRNNVVTLHKARSVTAVLSFLFMSQKCISYKYFQ